MRPLFAVLCIALMVVAAQRRQDRAGRAGRPGVAQTADANAPFTLRVDKRPHSDEDKPKDIRKALDRPKPKPKPRPKQQSGPSEPAPALLPTPPQTATINIELLKKLENSENSLNFNAIKPKPVEVKVERPESFEALEANSSLGIDYALFRASTDFECLRDPELEQLVHANGSRTRMYMLYHDERTGLIARRYAHCKDWIVPHRLRRSPYMESQVYRSLLQPQMRQHQLLEHFDFILTCTYRHALLGVDESFNDNVRPLSDAFLKQLIRSAVKHNYDAIPLITTPHMPVLVSLKAAHGAASVKAWKILLGKMDFSIRQQESCRHILGFWKSSMLIRTNALQDLTALMLAAQHLTENDGDVSKALKKEHSRHEAASSAPGGGLAAATTASAAAAPAFTLLHPFIFERLPAFFLATLNATVPNLTVEGKYKRPAGNSKPLQNADLLVW